jgi:hypothetical protein
MTDLRPHTREWPIGIHSESWPRVAEDMPPPPEDDDMVTLDKGIEE